MIKTLLLTKVKFLALTLQLQALFKENEFYNIFNHWNYMCYIFWLRNPKFRKTQIVEAFSPTLSEQWVPLDT